MAAQTGSGDGLFGTVITLAGFGFAGVGIIVALLVFIILMRGNTTDPAGDRLRNRFLSWGFGFAGFCGLLTVLGPWLAPSTASGAPARMRIDFSPDFKSNGLPDPSIMLPGGDKVIEGAEFNAASGPVLIRMDQALKQVADLKDAALKLADSASAAQKQATQATEMLTRSSAGTNPGVASARLEAADASRKSEAATAQLSDAIRSGQLGTLETKSAQLNQATAATFRARADVLKAAKP